MLNFERSHDQDTLIVTVDGRLEESDFQSFSRELDVQDVSLRPPTRLLIRAEGFPGWENFQAFAAHLRFISEHHKQIERIAIVTNSDLLKIAPKFASLFVHPKIRQFGLEESSEASTWLRAD